jgi:hypothetical protein
MHIADLHSQVKVLQYRQGLALFHGLASFHWYFNDPGALRGLYVVVSGRLHIPGIGYCPDNAALLGLDCLNYRPAAGI